MAFLTLEFLFIRIQRLKRIIQSNFMFLGLEYLLDCGFAGSNPCGLLSFGLKALDLKLGYSPFILSFYNFVPLVSIFI